MRRFYFFLAVLSLTICRADEAPNIVYIISDDQTWSDFGFMGNERVHTPNIDQLAGQSAVFTNGYVPSSVCRPSLVTLLTGLYPHEHKVHFNHGPPGNSGYNKMTSRAEYESTREKEFALIRKVKTLPELLVKQKDYRCFQTGKFWEGHWKNGGFTEGMTTFEPPPASQTYGGVRKLANGERVAHGNGDAGLQIGRETMQPIYDFIDDCEGKKTPWLVWYAPYLPHQPHDSPEKYYELAKSMRGVKPNEIPYYAAIAQFDDTVGELVRFVEDKGVARNTVFVFVVDNGWSPSTKPQKGREVEFEHTKRSKRAPFDDGLRTPILVRWDGIVQPREYEELVSSIDLVPTLLSAAGVKADRLNLPGVDLLPAMSGVGTLDKERALFGEIYPGDAEYLEHPQEEIAYRWVRKGDYKLIVPHGKKPWGNYLNEPALFNVGKDPREAKNLIDDPDLKSVVRELQQALEDWWDPDSLVGKRAAQNLVAVCSAAFVAGIDFVSLGEGDERTIIREISKGRKVEDSDSVFSGTFFGTTHYSEEVLEKAMPYLYIQKGRLLYKSERRTEG